MLKRVTSLSSVTARVRFPQRFKGTIVEKWADYWKNLCIDYVQMVKDVRGDIQSEPKNAFYYFGGLTAALILFRNNPNELDFKDELRKLTNETILVGEQCRNPKSTNHLLHLQRCYNEGVMRYRSFGLFSVMYKADYSDKCDLYKVNCGHVAPSYFNLPTRVIDVGVMGKWWNIFIKTSDYDINQEELLTLGNELGKMQI